MRAAFEPVQENCVSEKPVVFISWSGDRSKQVAAALRDWLGDVIQGVTLWMSDQDIKSGSRWLAEIGSTLERARFGVICLTPENTEAPWLLFEAGALARSLDESRVCPYVYGMDKSSVQLPIGQFHSEHADRQGTRALLASINEQLGDDRVPADRLERAFATWWPTLEERLSTLPKSVSVVAPRTSADMLVELINTTRSMSRLLSQRLPAYRGIPRPAEAAEILRVTAMTTTANDLLAALQEDHSLKSTGMRTVGVEYNPDYIRVFATSEYGDVKAEIATRDWFLPHLPERLATLTEHLRDDLAEQLMKKVQDSVKADAPDSA
jgi:TIR domain